MGKAYTIICRTPQKIISYQWNTQWANIQLHIKNQQIRALIEKYLLNRNLYLNTFFLRQTYQKICIHTTGYGFHKKPKFDPKRMFWKLEKKIDKPNQGLKRAKNSWSIKFLATFLQVYSNLPKIQLKFWNKYIRRNEFIQKKTGFLQIFKSYEKEYYYVPSLQVLNLLASNKITALILAKFICLHTRKNPQRLHFLIFFKRIFSAFVDAFFIAKPLIRGILVEVRGRFKPKKRRAKYTISLGQISLYSLETCVDYSNLVTFTIFGSLSVKVWIAHKDKTIHE